MSKPNVTLFVVIIIPLLLEWIKSVQISDLIPFSEQLIFDIYILDYAMNFSMLFELIGIIICFLDSSLVVMFTLGLLLWFELKIILWISETLLGESLEKAFFILMMLFILLIDAFAYDLIFNEEFDLEAWLFLKDLDFSKILLLDLDEIEGEILEISACFPLVYFLKGILLGENLLNYAKMHCLKDLLLLSAISLSQPAL